MMRLEFDAGCRCKGSQYTSLLSNISLQFHLQAAHCNILRSNIQSEDPSSYRFNRGESLMIGMSIMTPLCCV